MRGTTRERGLYHTLSLYYFRLTFLPHKPQPSPQRHGAAAPQATKSYAAPLAPLAHRFAPYYIPLGTPGLPAVGFAAC